MADIPTREIVTPLTKTKVVLKEYITGYDDEAIQAIYFKGAKKISGNQDTKDMGADYDGSVILEADHEGLRRVIVSVNGEAENIVDAVMNLPLKDSKFVQLEVQKVLRPLVEDEA